MTARRRTSDRAVNDARRNRRAWDADSDAYQEEHGRALTGQFALAWGIWRIPESELHVLGNMRGKRVLELGSGAAQWSIALKSRRAQPVALDNSLRQLFHAQTAATSAGVRLPLVNAAAEFLPFKDGSFDVVFCDYGGMSFADPFLTVPEVARVLGPEGLFAFSTTTPFLVACWPDGTDAVSPMLRVSYFGMHRARWSADDTVDFQLAYGEWIRLFRKNGFSIEDLIEIRPPARARTTFGGRPLRWARRWPAEMIWKVRKL